MSRESAETRNSSGSRRTRQGDHSISELARRQYGVVSKQQLLEVGVGENQIEHRLAIGRLHRLHQCVYAVGHLAIPREGRWMAAVIASGPDTLLRHWSAAALWGIRPNSKSRIDVTVSHRSRSSPAICRHISQVPPDE